MNRLSIVGNHTVGSVYTAGLNADVFPIQKVLETEGFRVYI